MNEGQKLVSFIIPVYNREKFLEECVESVFAQSYQDVEIILIDDGSTDNSLALARKLQQRDGRVRVLESAHLGVSEARNVGLDAAQGEYVFFLDSDDVIHPWLIETLVNSMENGTATMAGCDVSGVSEENWHLVKERLAQTPRQAGETVHKTNEQALDAALTRRSPVSVIGGVMMRRDLIGQTRFRNDLFVGEDGFFIYENLIKGPAVEFLKQKWYYVRYHQNNSTWNFGFDGFYTRFLRKKLTWESEERLGRPEYAKIQRAGLMNDYFLCVTKANKVDRKKIRSFMKTLKNELMPAMTITTKLQYVLSVYIPVLYNHTLFLQSVSLVKKRMGHKKKE